MKDDTGYKSDIYYDVIINCGEYRGWHCPDVGLGAMRFVHKDGRTLHIDKGSSDNWMNECWDDFLKQAEGRA